MSECRADFETRCDVNLKTCGQYVYFASPHFRPLGLSYRIEDGPMRDWEWGEPCPDDLREHIENGGYIRAFNAAFERQCIEWLHEHCGWPLPAMDRYRDTAAEAAAMSLPRSLDKLGDALGLDVKKDKNGTRLINKFSKPRRPRKDEDPNGVYFNEPADHPEDYRLFVEYRRQDVLTEEAAARRVIPLSTAEQALWVLNEETNSRGIRIDVASARAAINIAEKSKKALDREMRIVTGGYVTTCSQVEKIVSWVESQGVSISSAQKAEITDLLEADDLPANVRRALELRQEAAKTSVTKINAFIRRANSDGRVRGSSLYHGASTGRFQSAGVNFSNLPRPRREFDEAVVLPNGKVRPPRADVLFQAFKSEDPDVLPYLYGDGLGRPLHLISDAIRGFIWAAPGHDLIQADYSNIEGNVLAWLAGEEWKLEAVRAINADPSLPDMYRRTAASILGLPIEEVTKKHWARQAVGKPAELGLGYGGGVMAFVTFAKGYGVDLEPIAASILENADGERYERAAKRYEGQLKRGKSGTDLLSRDAWIACEIVKLGWRASNPAIAQSWRDLEGAVREAVQNPGTVTEAAKVRYRVAKGFLWALLPSGRCLAYGSPKLKDQVWAKVKLDDGSWSDAEVMEREAAEAGERRGTVKIEGDTSAKVTVLGVDSVTKKWRRFGLYGGLIAENNTQAVARDILVSGMWKATNAGYPIIATVYDEIIAEVPRGFGSVSEFEALICELPEWADGLPLTAGGWRGKRYRKD